jgi:phosphomannomutase
MEIDQVKLKAHEYLTYNQDEKHSKVIQDLLDRLEIDKLRELLMERMSFGTAGLRGPLGPGLNQMNGLVVLQTTQGVIHVLEEEFKHLSDWKSRGVVIGYDHRYESKDFAHLIAGSFIGKGIKVFLYRNIVATPLVPFGIKSLNALCGVMITASHNPKEDNGYKLYWKNACQIIPPLDSKISNAILNNLKPWNWNPELITESVDPENVLQEYFDKVQNLKSFTNQNMNLKFCYTAMHGVGWPFAERVFKTFGLSGLVPVQEQVRDLLV